MRNNKQKLRFKEWNIIFFLQNIYRHSNVKMYITGLAKSKKNLTQFPTESLFSGKYSVQYEVREKGSLR